MYVRMYVSKCHTIVEISLAGIRNTTFENSPVRLYISYNFVRNDSSFILCIDLSTVKVGMVS